MSLLLFLFPFVVVTIASFHHQCPGEQVKSAVTFFRLKIKTYVLHQTAMVSLAVQMIVVKIIMAGLMRDGERLVLTMKLASQWDKERKAKFSSSFSVFFFFFFFFLAHLIMWLPLLNATL